MARYRIRYWRDFPSVVTAEDGEGRVKELLPQRFQDAIDRAAMVSGSADSDAYLEGWEWGPVKSLPGPANHVAKLLVVKLDSEFTDDRLADMVKAHRRSASGE